MSDIVERLRDQRDEDGYCVVCGDGKWKSHFPRCVMCDAADEIERLRALITAWITAWAEAQSALDNASWDESKQLHAFAKAKAALRKAVGR